VQENYHCEIEGRVLDLMMPDETQEK